MVEDVQLKKLAVKPSPGRRQAGDDGLGTVCHPELASAETASPIIRSNGNFSPGLSNKQK